jgi:hypothetical protein
MAIGTFSIYALSDSSVSLGAAAGAVQASTKATKKTSQVPATAVPLLSPKGSNVASKPPNQPRGNKKKKKNAKQTAPPFSLADLLPEHYVSLPSPSPSPSPCILAPFFYFICISDPVSENSHHCQLLMPTISSHLRYMARHSKSEPRQPGGSGAKMLRMCPSPARKTAWLRGQHQMTRSQELHSCTMLEAGGGAITMVKSDFGVPTMQTPLSQSTISHPMGILNTARQIIGHERAEDPVERERYGGAT